MPGTLTAFGVDIQLVITSTRVGLRMEISQFCRLAGGHKRPRGTSVRPAMKVADPQLWIADKFADQTSADLGLFPSSQLCVDLRVCCVQHFSVQWQDAPGVRCVESDRI